MAITWDDVIAFAPELQTVAAGAQTVIVDHVNNVVTVEVWGVNYALGARLLAAHMGTMAKRAASGIAGPVVSESLDGASVSYGAYIGGSMGPWNATPYGRDYARMLRLVGGGGFSQDPYIG